MMNSLLYKISLKIRLDNSEIWIIQKFDKGNPVVIVDRQDYKNKMDIVLSD